MKRISRRLVLKGIGGVALSLPLLEAFRPRIAQAADDAPPFAIFFRQANGVACASSGGTLGDEPERFWPKSYGALTSDNVSGRALDELDAYLSRLLVVHNVNMYDFPFGDGHARGALQGLTARGPTESNAGGDSEAAGESIDHRIGRELNPDGRDSLFLYSGSNGGWLGGPCISYRGPAQRRSALHDPWTAYESIVGDTGLTAETRAALVGRQKSVNDFVRDELTTLMKRPELGKSDKDRLELHFSSVRDLEMALTCRLQKDQELQLQNLAPGYDSSDGDDVIETTKLHMEIVALAVACGYTRSAAIQVGSGNDGSTRYPDPDSGGLMNDNFHYISHRRKSHDSSGSVIPGSDLLHHKIDRQFAQMFRHLLDKLNAYQTPSGKPLLDSGIAVWYNDNGNGPPHSSKNVPYVIAGGANGFLKQGQYVELGEDGPNHKKLLNTLASAVGVKGADGGYLQDFGDDSLPQGVLNEIMAV